MKKFLALLLTVAMVFAMAACSAPAAEETKPAEEGAAAPAEETSDKPAAAGSVYYLNFKPEADAAWQELAKKYTELTGVPVKVVTAASGDYQTTLTSEMDKSEAPTLFQCGNQGALNTWGEYCLDLKDTDFYKEMTTDDFNLFGENGEVLAAVGYHEVLSDRFYEEFQDEAAVHYLRKNAAGRLAVITGVAGLRDEKVYEWIQLAMTETIAACLKLGFTHIACRFENEEREMDMEMEKLLYRFGFLKMPSGVKNKDRYLVDMTYPLVLIQNVSTELKAPFDRNPRVRKVLLETGHALLDAMKELYPGNLVISFDAQHMNQQMMDLITFENHVPAQQGAKRVLGKKMCVPFGKILRDVVVPNTVTKAIYTEKVYTRDASASRIEEYPNYSPLPTQIETIKSFKRPVILADDILHKGDRIKKLYPMLKKSGVPVERLVVGILSGHGTDLSSMLKLPVESIYYIPNVKAWFQESTLYPFLGGDMIEQTQKSRTGLLPAIYQILPYVIPQFLPELGWQQFNNLSLICLLNTQKILRVLEAEYQKGFGRNLTLGRLGEAVKDPYCVDVGSHVTLDLNVPASEYIENDIIRLKHLKNLVD